MEEIQPKLFNTSDTKTENILLYALGDFQHRGFELVGRKLPMDRLLGAFKRAFEKFEIDLVSVDKIAETLEKLGAKIDKVPNYVAKHPYRITVYNELAEKSLNLYETLNKKH